MPVFATRKKIYRNIAAIGSTPRTSATGCFHLCPSDFAVALERSRHNSTGAIEGSHSVAVSSATVNRDGQCNSFDCIIISRCKLTSSTSMDSVIHQVNVNGMVRLG